MDATQIKSKILKKEEYEDFLFGSLMGTSKTGNTVSKSTIINKLKK